MKVNAKRLVGPAHGGHVPSERLKSVLGGAQAGDLLVGHQAILGDLGLVLALEPVAHGYPRHGKTKDQDPD